MRLWLLSFGVREPGIGDGVRLWVLALWGLGLQSVQVYIKGTHTVAERLYAGFRNDPTYKAER